jgi:pantothenate kinase type III
MKEIITIDLGNTNQDFIHFKGGAASPKLAISEFEAYLLHFNIDNPKVLISDVLGNSKQFFNLKNTVFINELIKENSFLDMKMNYSKTIGADRICQAYYAYKKYTDAIIFDSGTFTTVDYVSKSGLEGGNIYPGMNLLTESFNKGSNLSLSMDDFNNSNSGNIKISHNTTDAMINATKHIYSLLLDEILKDGLKKIILTGGASELFKHLADTHKNVIYKPDFIHEALFFIEGVHSEYTSRN